MAKSKKASGIILGFDDEMITEKHKSDVGYWCNKFGGLPDWPVDGVSSPSCQLCGLVQPLVVQIYASLENSPYHRTLYLFGCINPNCWNHSESWTCLRSQLLDSEYQVSSSAAVNITSPSDWCTGANNWDDDDDNGNFENGNTIKERNQYSPSDYDSDDDSSSLSAAVGNLNVDECNANWGNLEKSSGAVGKQTAPIATAEIEREESEVVSIDTPTAPQKDLLALLQESAPVPFHLQSGERNQNISLSFIPYFISIGEEGTNCYSSDHVRELFQEYQRNHEDAIHHGMNLGREGGGDGSSEDYEKGLPAHGDKMFHQFLSRIQLNPGQIIRYSRGSEPPLLLYPLQEYPRKCKNCNGDVVFEFQILPTIIPKLKLPGENETRLEFGTVLIFTCKRSCWALEDKCREEEVIVQVEKT